MKVDLVVNSMIQQIDRNLQAQIMPALAFRAGEILRGRVMLDAGNKPQIRLDSGELLSALPSGDVQLFAGATVTLRVTGNMDGQFVMQLLDQEVDTGTTARQPQESAGAALTRLGLGGSAQGRAILSAMETMRVPLREETARQAMTIMNTFPGLSGEKAVFLAANTIIPTDATVTALNALVDNGATTGGELMKLVDILASQALNAEGGAVKQGNAAAAVPSLAQAAGQALPTAEPEAAAAGWVTAQPADEGLLPGGTVAQAASPSHGMTAPSSLARGDAMLELQSLMAVALGPEASVQYAGVAAALQQRGLTGDAVRLALDGSLAFGQEFEASLGAFLAALPEDEAAQVRAFITRLAEGLERRAQAAAAGGPAAPQDAPQGLQRAVKEIMDLFVRMDADPAAHTAELKSSGKLTRETLQRMPAELADAGAASPAAAQQLGRVENHVRLLDNISQYIYQQIPVDINGRSKTVELYVMNRGGGGKKINPEKANILIALDTENMGRLETLISVNSRNLRLRFGVENPELVGYVDSYTAEIGRAMQEIGFKLSDVRMQVTAKPVTPLTAAAESESWQESPARLDIVL